MYTYQTKDDAIKTLHDKLQGLERVHSFYCKLSV